MSEPSSLYARIHLTEAALAAYRAGPPALPSQFDDWQPWLATRQFHGSITGAGIAALTHDGIPTVEEMLTTWLDSPYGSAGREGYDPATQTWSFAILECSENYMDFILALAWLRAIAAHKDLPGDDFILIFPFLWGGEPEAFLVVSPGASHFQAGIPPDLLAAAHAAFQQIVDELAAAFGDQNL